MKRRAAQTVQLTGRKVGVLGAGLAGLTAAVTAHELGAEVVVLERGAAPGGTSVLSNGWIWRYRDRKLFRWGAPHGEKSLQDAVWKMLPDALTWLENKGARIAARTTANPLTDGIRVEPAQVIDVLDRKLSADQIKCDSVAFDVQRLDSGGYRIFAMRNATYDNGRWSLSGSVDSSAVRTFDVDAVIFAGGGYAADVERLERENQSISADTWTERHSGLSAGISIDAACALGALRTPITGEFYGRALPYGVVTNVNEWTQLSQLYAEHCTAILDANGQVIERSDHDWSDTLVVWKLARSTGKGWYMLEHAALNEKTVYGPVSRLVRAAMDAGGTVVEAAVGELADRLALIEGFDLSPDTRELIQDCVCAVAVRPGVTHTIGGLRVDTSARLQIEGIRKPTLFAAGVDAGGIADGGYASGLAQALALGRIAGINAARVK